jgi:Carboxypeptidase regulatory-like domain
MKLAAWMLLASQAALLQAVTVTGSVTNAITHEPLAGVKVILFEPGDIHETATDAGGMFRIENVKTCCRLLFDKDGFEPVGPRRLQFESATDPAPVRLTMLPWPILRGRVVNADRHPIAAAKVEAFHRFWGHETATTTTDGGFVFNHINPGEYTLQATSASPESAGATELAPTWFPNATERANAGTVMLRAGDDLPGFEIVVQRVPVFQVSGRVLDEHGDPVVGAQLQVPLTGTKSTSEESGVFHLRSVRPGSDLLRAEFRRDDIRLRGLVQLIVHDHDVDNVTVRISPPVAFSGAVDLDGAQSPVEGQAFLEPVDDNGFSAQTKIERTEIHFKDVYPGCYRLDVQISTGFAHTMYLDSVRLGDRDITAEPFDVVPGMLPFHVIVKTGGGRVRGTVEDGAGGIAVLVPQDERQRKSSMIATSFFTGAQFSIENVRPGDYYAFVVRNIFNHSDMLDPASARPFLAAAEKVRVEDTRTATVTLKYPK